MHAWSNQPWAARMLIRPSLDTRPFLCPLASLTWDSPRIIEPCLAEHTGPKRKHIKKFFFLTTSFSRMLSHLFLFSRNCRDSVYVVFVRTCYMEVAYFIIIIFFIVVIESRAVQTCWPLKLIWIRANSCDDVTSIGYHYFSGLWIPS